MNNYSAYTNKPLYNSTILYVYIRLIHERYPYVDVDEILNYAKIKPYEITDQGHWFTQEQTDRFYEKVVQLTGNENIDREAGRYISAPHVIRMFEHFVFGKLGPLQLYQLFGKITQYFVKSSTYQTKKIASNKVEITVTQQEGCNEKPYQCENRIGCFEAIALRFTSKLPKIEHPECIFQGGDCFVVAILFLGKKNLVF